MKETKVIYILLSHSGSMFSKLINICSGFPYTHVSIALDSELNELYSFGRIHPYNPIIGGFVREDIENGTFSRFPETMCALYSLEIEEEQYNNLERELERFKKEKDKYGYNLLGVLSAAFNFPLRRRYNYFCSQFVSELLQKSGIRILDKSPDLTSPMDFGSCKELEIVYEGYLRTYNEVLDNNVSVQL